MDSFWNITIGEVLTISVALLAIIFATLIGRRQNKINCILLNLQDLVELYISFDPIMLRDAIGDQKDLVVPGLFIRNLGSAVIYLNKYLFNGKEYPLNDEVLPPVSQYNGFHYIYLPTDGTTHVSFEIFFSSWAHDRWETKGYADFMDGRWKITYEPCKRSANK